MQHRSQFGCDFMLEIKCGSHNITVCFHSKVVQGDIFVYRRLQIYECFTDGNEKRS